MLKAITLFLIFQLIGETLVRAVALQVPGPVVGMALFLAALLIRYRGGADRPAPAWLSDTADGLLKHLSLLFVPASVGLVQHLERLESEWLPIGVALLVSTVAAIAVGAVTFVLVARWSDHVASGAEVKDTGDGSGGDGR